MVIFIGTLHFFSVESLVGHREDSIVVSLPKSIQVWAYNLPVTLHIFGPPTSPGHPPEVKSRAEAPIRSQLTEQQRKIFVFGSYVPGHPAVFISRVETPVWWGQLTKTQGKKATYSKISIK